MATSSLDRAIRVWDARSRQLVQHYPAHTGAVHSLQFHHSGDFLLSSSEDGTVKVRRVVASFLVLLLHPPAPARTNQLLILFIYPQIWDVREGRLLFAVHGHAGAVAHAAFSPDAEQTLFASAGKQDQLVKVWRSNLACYINTNTKGPGPGDSLRQPQSQPPPRPVSAPPLQRVLYHLEDELLPGPPRRVKRPAYQRPTPTLPTPTHHAAPEEEGLWQQQQHWGEEGGGGGDDDAPTAAQTLKGRTTGRGGSGEGEARQRRQQQSSSSLRRRSRQLQQGAKGLDVDDEGEEDENGWGTKTKAVMHKGGGAAVAAPVLVAPSAPPLEEEEEEVPRQHRPPRPDSAGCVATVNTGEVRLQQTLEAMSQTMTLIAERLALVENRLAEVTIDARSSPSPSPTVELPAPPTMRQTGGGRGRMPE